MSDGHRHPLAPPRAIAKGGRSPKVPGIRRIVHEGWGCDLAGASHRLVLPAAPSRDSRGLCLPLLTAAGTRRVSIATAFSPGGPGLPRGACCAWRSGSRATVKPRAGGTAWLLQSSRARGPRPGCGGRKRPRGGPGPGACGASAELAGRAGARAAAPPPGRRR